MIDENNREIWVDQNRLYLGEDNILYETVVGDVDEKIAIAIRDVSRKMVSNVQGKTKVLIDLTKAGRPSVGARKIGIERLKDERIGRVALFGVHPLLKMIESFGMGVSEKKDIRFFKTQMEALAWLKE